jgi:FkbM family methyltransferase
MLKAVKRRAAAHLRPFVERIVAAKLDEAAARWSKAHRVLEEELRRSLPPPPAMVAPAGFRLPPNLRLLHIPGAGNPDFDLVVRADPGPYDRVMIAGHPYSDIAALLNLELGGAGTLIDLGANIGTVALPVAAAGSAVVAVEPLPGNCLRLLLAALANGLPHLRVVQAAAGAADGLLPFSGDEAWGAVAAAGAGRQEVVALRLDTILADAARENPALLRAPFALKIDVEGHEYEALLGAEGFLAEHRPVVVFESIEMGEGIEKTRRCKELLAGRGYRLFLLKERLLVPKSPADVQEELVGDFVAVPEERAGATLDRLVGYKVRQPTTGERLRWLAALAGEAEEHRRHALRVIDALARDDPGFAAASADLRRRVAAALG